MIRETRRFILYCVVLAVTAPDGVAAQRLSQPFATVNRHMAPTPAPATTQGEMPAAGTVALWSLVGGTAGVVAGYAVGYPLLYAPDRKADLQRGCEDCGLDGAIAMAGLMVLGEAIGIAVGAHLGNSGRGSLGADLAVSVGSLVVGALVAGAAAQVPGGEVLALAVPLAQIGAVVLTERRTARAKARATPGLAAQPAPAWGPPCSSSQRSSCRTLPVARATLVSAAP